MSYNSHRIVSYGPYRLAFDMGAYHQFVVVSGDDVIPAGSIIVNAWLQNYAETLWTNVSNDVDLEAMIVTDDGHGTIGDWFSSDLHSGGPTGGTYLLPPDGGSDTPILVSLDAQVCFTVLGANAPLQGASDLTLLVILPA